MYESIQFDARGRALNPMRGKKDARLDRIKGGKGSKGRRERQYYVPCDLRYECDGTRLFLISVVDFTFFPAQLVPGSIHPQRLSG